MESSDGPPGAPARRVSPWNEANAVTGVRILLVPVFLWLLLHEDGTSAGWRIASFAVFVLAAATDRLDGELARRRGLITDLGKIADPIADKALIGGALIGLSLVDLLPWWATVVVLAREVLVTVLRFVVVRRGVIAAGRGGKIKTTLQVVVLAAYLLPLPAWTHGPLTALLLLTVVVTVLTAVDVVRQALALRRPAGR